MLVLPDEACWWQWAAASTHGFFAPRSWREPCWSWGLPTVQAAFTGGASAGLVHCSLRHSGSLCSVWNLRNESYEMMT